MDRRVWPSLLALAVLPVFAGCDFRLEKSPGPLAPAETVLPAANVPDAGCTGDDPAAILGCERAKYGHMSGDELTEFLKHSAQSLNRNGIADGPYGVLRKGTGSSCGGYSCDIICAGEGTAQRQHDVLLDAEDAQIVTWGDAHTYPHIRVDACDVQ